MDIVAVCWNCPLEAATLVGNPRDILGHGDADRGRVEYLGGIRCRQGEREGAHKYRLGRLPYHLPSEHGRATHAPLSSLPATSWDVGVTACRTPDASLS